MKLGEKLIRFILKHSFWVIILNLIITAAAIYFIPRIKLDNSVDALFDKKSKSYKDFQIWKEQFGSDDVVIVAFADKDIFTEENLKLISRLTLRFESLPYVDKVTSITNVNDIVGSDNDFIVKRLYEGIPASNEELKNLKKQALDNPLYLKDVISEDGKTAALIVELNNDQTATDSYKKETILNIKKILKEEIPQDKRYYLSGRAIIEFFFAKYMQDDLKTFLPMVFLIVLIVLIFSFRGAAGVILPFLVVTISVIWTMAFFYLCGYSINNITTIIPPIMISITLLESIHFVWELIERKELKNDLTDKNSIIADTMRHLFIPCFLTNVTTVIGFFSLLVNIVPPIRQLGWASGIGVLFAFIITFTFLPAVIKQLNLLNYLSAKQTNSSFKKKFDYRLLGLTKFSDKFKIPILIVTAIIIILSLWMTSKIKTETNVLEYFKKSDPVYKAANFIEKNLSGVHFLNIALKIEDRDYFKEPEALRKIEELQNFLKSVSEIDKTTSVGDYIKEINKSFHNEDENFYKLPDDRNLIAQYLLLYGENDLDRLVNSDWNWTTVRVRLNEHSTAKLKKIIAEIENYLKKNFNSSVSTHILGGTVLEVETNEAVTSGQVQSLGLAFIFIFGMMFIDFKSISLGLISLVPNLFPLLLNFGIMGLLNIRLDSATSIISDIGIGIIVDDTIHFYHTFGEMVKKTGDYRESLYKSFIVKGSPTIITSIIIILGFGVMSFSKFVPTYYFGLLSALLIFNALLSELVLSPALLMLVKPKFPRKIKLHGN